MMEALAREGQHPPTDISAKLEHVQTCTAAATWIRDRDPAHVEASFGHWLDETLANWGYAHHTLGNTYASDGGMLLQTPVVDTDTDRVVAWIDVKRVEVQ